MEPTEQELDEIEGCLISGVKELVAAHRALVEAAIEERHGSVKDTSTCPLCREVQRSANMLGIEL